MFLYRSLIFNTFKDDIENGLSVGKSFERRIRNKYAGQKL